MHDEKLTIAQDLWRIVNVVHFCESFYQLELPDYDAYLDSCCDDNILKIIFNFLHIIESSAMCHLSML